MHRLSQSLTGPGRSASHWAETMSRSATLLSRTAAADLGQIQPVEPPEVAVKFKFIAEFADQLAEKFHGAPGRSVVVNDNDVECVLGLHVAIRGFHFKYSVAIHAGSMPL